MRCKYCSQTATGINYRPSPSLQNIPACPQHATALFISFTAALSSPDQPAATKLQTLLQKLMDCILAEFNLIKSEVLYQEKQMRRVTQFNAMTFRMECELTTPYVIIPADEELMLSTLIKRIKVNFEREKVERERKSLFDSKIKESQAELLKDKLSINKSYVFFTPQSTERSRFENSAIKKSYIVPYASTTHRRSEKKDEWNA